MDEVSERRLVNSQTLPSHFGGYLGSTFESPWYVNILYCECLSLHSRLTSKQSYRAYAFLAANNSLGSRPPLHGQFPKCVEIWHLGFLENTVLVKPKGTAIPSTDC